MSFSLATLAVFGSGVTGAISPCVLPLVPGYLGVLSSGTGRDRRRNVATFAITVAACFAAVGAAVHTFGEQIPLADSMLRRLAGLVLIVAAASSIVLKRYHYAPNLPGLSKPIGTASAVALGLGCTLSWTPCTGPLLGAVLTSAAGQDSLWRATTLLVAYTAGVMTPLFVLAAIDLRQAPAWLRTLGHRAAQITPYFLVTLGALLVADYYDSVIAFLPVK